MFFIIVCKMFIGYTELYEQFNINSFIMDCLYIIFVFFLIRFFITKKIRPTLYSVLSLIVGVLLIICVLYKRFYGVMPTYHSLALANQTVELKGSISSLWKWQDLYYIGDMIIIPFFDLQGRENEQKSKGYESFKKSDGRDCSKFCSCNIYIHLCHK